MRALCGSALAALLLLAGCAPAPLPDVAIGHRNPTVTLAGSTRFDPARFAGEWITTACLGSCADRMRFRQTDAGLLLQETAQGAAAFRAEGPGVLRAVEGDARLVVMWVDEGFRTAAIGDADGRWAAVIDRSGKGGADRRKAAIEVLDFNGWQVAALQP